tara:strand:- start:1 stop:309 length:309 start_codon:yes stop_codon:yes gene_type:complete
LAHERVEQLVLETVVNHRSTTDAEHQWQRSKGFASRQSAGKASGFHLHAAIQNAAHGCCRSKKRPTVQDANAAQGCCRSKRPTIQDAAQGCCCYKREWRASR